MCENPDNLPQAVSVIKKHKRNKTVHQDSKDITIYDLPYNIPLVNGHSQDNRKRYGIGWNIADPFMKKGVKKKEKKKKVVVNKDSRLGKLYDDENGICFYCKKWIELNQSTLDHIIPKSFLRKHKLVNDPNVNYRLSCGKCNVEKGSKIRKEDEWIIKVLCKNGRKR